MSTFLHEHNAPILSPFVYKQLKIGLLEKDLGTQCFCLRACLTLAHVRGGWIATQLSFQAEKRTYSEPIQLGRPVGWLQSHMPLDGPWARPVTSELGTYSPFAHSNDLHLGEDMYFQSPRH